MAKSTKTYKDLDITEKKKPRNLILGFLFSNKQLKQQQGSFYLSYLG